MPQGNTPSGFLKLPAEVRNVIYEDVLDRDNFPSDPQNYFSLTKVSRRIRLETHNMAMENIEFFTARNQQFVLRSRGDQEGPLSSAYLTLPPAVGQYVWPSNTVDPRAFAWLRDVTLFFEEDEPMDLWSEDAAPWKRLCTALTSQSVGGEDMLLDILSTRVNFVELTNPDLVTTSHRIRNERDIELLGIRSLYDAYCSVRLRSFHPDAADEYMIAQAVRRSPLWRFSGLHDLESFRAMTDYVHVFRA